jgi:hypothetical protein
MNKVLFFLLFSFTLYAIPLTENGALKPTAKEILTLFDVQDNLPLEEICLLLENQWLQAYIESWNMDLRFEDKYDQIFPFFEQLQYTNTIKASKEHYNYALVLGATKKVMEIRLNFLYEEWLRGVRFDRIVLLAGARDLNPAVEIYPEELKTENELLIYLFNRHPLKELAPYVVIDSPKQMLENGTLRRPTTSSNIIDWLKSNPKPGSCLAVSTQPFLNYQESVIRYHLPSSFDIELIGPEVRRKYPLSNYLDLFAKQLKYEQQLIHETEMDRKN